MTLLTDFYYFVRWALCIFVAPRRRIELTNLQIYLVGSASWAIWGGREMKIDQETSTQTVSLTETRHDRLQKIIIDEVLLCRPSSISQRIDGCTHVQLYNYTVPNVHCTDRRQLRSQLLHTHTHYISSSSCTLLAASQKQKMTLLLFHRCCRAAPTKNRRNHGGFFKTKEVMTTVSSDHQHRLEMMRKVVFESKEEEEACEVS